VWAARREGTPRALAGSRYAADFPYCTVRDTVALHYELLQHLGVASVHAVIGGSAGGMQALEWSIMYPDFVQRCVALACGASQSAWQLGISESQRQAIYRDAEWNDGFYALGNPPREGLNIARQQAMIWYRSQQAYDRKFARDPQPPNGGGVAERANLTSGGGPTMGGAPPTYAVEGYLEHQGLKFIDRFDANTYVALTRLIDSHDVGRGRGGVDLALSQIRCPVLVVGISSDVLYPIEMQRELAARIPRSTLRIVTSIQGHDGFLLEGKRIGALITASLQDDGLSPQPESGASGTSGGETPTMLSDDEGASPTVRQLTLALPRTMDAMNEALARTPRMKKPPLATAKGQEWFFGI